MGGMESPQVATTTTQTYLTLVGGRYAHVRMRRLRLNNNGGPYTPPGILQSYHRGGQILSSGGDAGVSHSTQNYLIDSCGGVCLV